MRRIVFTILFVLSWSLVARGETMERIDAVVRQARDLDDLLAKPELVEEYFSALQKYYGESAFPRASFDATIAQLREAKEKVPGLKGRLWETTGLGESFTIDTAVKTHGRSLAGGAWTKYREEWAQRLKGEAKAIFDVPDGDRAERTREILREAQSRVDALERRLKEKSPSARVAAAERREFFERLRKEPALDAAMAYVTLKHLEMERVKDLIGSGDADLVLDTLRGYKQNPTELIDSRAGLPPLAHSLVRERLPDLKDLLARTDLFPVVMRKTGRGKEVPVGSGGAVTYRFVPIARRLHGIWKGVPLNECVGGNCKSLDSLTPERWATIALAGSQLHHVERVQKGEEGPEADYMGYVHTVPVQSPKDGVVGSLELGAPVLRQKAIVPGAHGNEISTVFAQWLPKALAARPKEWAGFAMGASNAIANAGMLPTARSSAAYVFGRPIGNGKLMVHPDPMAAAIADALPRNGYAESYGGRMITELTVKNSGPITLFNEATNDDKLLSGEDVATASGATDPDFMRRLIGAYHHRRRFPNDPRILRLVVAALDYGTSETRNAAEELFKTLRAPDEATAQTLGEVFAERITAGSERAAAIVEKINFRSETLGLKLWELMHQGDSAGTKLAYRLRYHVDPKFPSIAAKLEKALAAEPGSPAAALILYRHGRASARATDVLAGTLRDTPSDADSATQPSRLTVIETLGMKGGNPVVAAGALQRHYATEPTAYYRMRAIEALKNTGARPDVDFLVRATEDGDAGVQRFALEALGASRSQDPRAGRAIERAVASDDINIRVAAFSAAWQLRLYSRAILNRAESMLDKNGRIDAALASVYLYDVGQDPRGLEMLRHTYYQLESSGEQAPIFGRADLLNYLGNGHRPNIPNTTRMINQLKDDPQTRAVLVARLAEHGLTDWCTLWVLSEAAEKGDPESVRLRNDVHAIARPRLGADWKFFEHSDEEIAKLTVRDAEKVRYLIKVGGTTKLWKALTALLKGAEWNSDRETLLLAHHHGVLREDPSCRFTRI